MVSQSTANTPKKIHKDSVANTDFAQSNSVEQGTTTSAPCETSKPVTNFTPLSGMLNHVYDDMSLSNKENTSTKTSDYSVSLTNWMGAGLITHGSP